MIEGSDAVICVLGHVSGSPNNLMQKSIENIISAMKVNSMFEFLVYEIQEHHVSRLVYLTGTAIDDPEDGKGSFSRTFANGLFKAFAAKIANDHQAAHNYVRSNAEGIQWINTRPPRLTKKPKTGNYKVKSFAPIGLGSSLSYPDLADFMLSCVGNDDWVNKSPVVYS